MDVFQVFLTMWILLCNLMLEFVCAEILYHSDLDLLSGVGLMVTLNAVTLAYIDLYFCGFK